MSFNFGDIVWWRPANSQTTQRIAYVEEREAGVPSDVTYKLRMVARLRRGVLMTLIGPQSVKVSWKSISLAPPEIVEKLHALEQENQS